MAWGARAGVDDLLDKLKKPATGKSLAVLSFRKLSEADVAKLAGAIAGNTMLEELYLSGHKLGPGGVTAFADCLAVNKTLKHLSIGEDTLGDAGVAALCAGLSRNAQSGVKVWDLEHKAIGEAGASAIGDLLKTNTSVKSLNLARNPLTDASIKALADGLAANATSGLETLTLSDATITGQALSHLAGVVGQAQSSLQMLQLSFNALVDADASFFAALGSNASLKRLYLKECKLNDAHAVALSEALKTNTTLEEVDLSDNELTTTAYEALAQALQSNKALKSLTLGNNKGGDAGAVALAESLAQSSTTLEFLDLSKNQLTHVGISKLLAVPKVKKLGLFNNALGDGLEHVLPALLANHHIETLDLGANALHEALSVQLFEAIHAHPSLKTLEVGGNSLGQDGHTALEKLREVNRTLDVAVDKNAQNEDGSFDLES
ncbi:hypothetical protein Poli38472_000952 [Pythium oligandrum]|uniref:Uncharacterized protein n=1 Tax=Pythium oligandrum TaxID=41045 RepID=A0A8K1CD27_PYTOL|nr:hypothetical protein Poli38472_000952 [Pythium oligandrum]|eukprot:TMW60910.1 hypothetical protein Poli38472_000952 [Pythium oligandrum]